MLFWIYTGGSYGAGSWPKTEKKASDYDLHKASTGHPVPFEKFADTSFALGFLLYAFSLALPKLSVVN
jgi:hypothetical protein